MVTRLYAILNVAIKTHLEGKQTEGKMLTDAEGTAETTSNTAIKRETTGETKVNEKEREPHNMTDRAT